MKEHPIIFSDPMVRAILDGRKTQTRRPIKGVPAWTCGLRWSNEDGRWVAEPDVTPMNVWERWRGPKSAMVGDRLWVREGWRTHSAAWDTVAPRDLDAGTPVLYDADRTALVGKAMARKRGKGRPSIHMPRWASRITLEVTRVRVERLQEISGKEARAEGIEGDTRDCRLVHLPRLLRDRFASLWDALYVKRPELQWAANPWVLVYDFRRIEP